MLQTLVCTFQTLEFTFQTLEQKIPLEQTTFCLLPKLNKNLKNPLVLSGLLLCRFAARNLSDLTDRETWDGMNLAVLASTIGYILL